VRTGDKHEQAPRWRRVTLAAASAILLIAPLAESQAAGFYLNQVGTPGSLGTAAAANVTNTWGPDAAWANPAGLVGTGDRRVMTASAQLLVPIAEFDPSVAEAGGDDGGDAGDPAVIPSFFYSQRLNEDWAFGFGVSALQGGGVDYGDKFAGRYATIDVALTGLAATWSVGRQITDRLSLGLGGTVVQTNFEQTIAVNQGAAPDARVAFRDLDDVGVQGILGLQYQLSDNLTFGATYRSEFDANLEGNVKFRNFVVPLPNRRNLEVDWTNPQWVEAGLKLRTNSGRFWFLSGNWQEWSEFSDNQLSIDTNLGNAVQTLERDWDDTWSVGIAHASQADANEGWSFGMRYESSPVDDDKRTIDLPLDESWSFSVGYGNFNSDKSRGWSAAATLQVFGDAEVDQTAQQVRFAGDFDKYYVLFVGGNLRF